MLKLLGFVNFLFEKINLILYTYNLNTNILKNKTKKLYKTKNNNNNFLIKYKNNKYLIIFIFFLNFCVIFIIIIILIFLHHQLIQEIPFKHKPYILKVQFLYNILNHHTSRNVTNVQGNFYT